MSEIHNSNPEIEKEVQSEEIVDTNKAAESSENNDKSTKKETQALPPHKEYAKRMAQFNVYYFQLLAIIGAIVILAVVLAVTQSVIVGVSLAVASAVLYKFFTSDEMFKRLGMDYSSVEGGMRVKACRARYGDVMWIPSKLIWFDVIEIGDRAFASEKNAELKRVFFPVSLKKIGEDIFADNTSVSEIFFEGTQEEWEKIEKHTDLSDYKVIFEAKYPPIPKKKKKQPLNKSADKNGK